MNEYDNWKTEEPVDYPWIKYGMNKREYEEAIALGLIEEDEDEIYTNI